MTIMASSSSDEDFLLLESTYVKYRKRRTVSVSDINRKRTKYGIYYHLFLKHIKEDEQEFYNYTRMTQETFYYKLNKIEQSIHMSTPTRDIFYSISNNFNNI